MVELGSIAYMYAESELSMEEAVFYAKELRERGEEVGEDKVFYEELSAAIREFRMSAAMDINGVAEAADVVCDYCKERVELKEIILVNGNAAHEPCAVRAGDIVIRG